MTLARATAAAPAGAAAVRAGRGRSEAVAGANPVRPVLAELALGLPALGPRLQRRCACAGNCPKCSIDDEKIRPRLVVGAVDDPLEHEADRAADKAMGFGAGTLPGPSAATAEPRAVLHRLDLTQGGVPLGARPRAFYEARFGRDLRHVRVHTGDRAQAHNRRLNAQAFTYGEHVWLGWASAAAPSWLLAHELAHVVQQTQPAAAAPAIRRVPLPCAGDPDLPPPPDGAEFVSDVVLATVRSSIFERKHLWVRRGDSGAGVVLLQRLLLNLVCDNVDRAALLDELAMGIFGAQTQAAVERYQDTHADAIGRPLAVDGRVGPLSLGALDESLGLAAQAPARRAEGEGNCFGEAEQGPGEARRLLPAEVPPFEGFQPNEAVWEVSNFDVAKHFVKTEHRAFLRDNVVAEINAKPVADTRVRLIGEASTTASQDFNLPLSQARARCVHEALVAEGVDPSRLDPIAAHGELYAQLRLAMAGKPFWVPVEDRRARKVSIVLGMRTVDDCSSTTKKRGSTKFVARVACESAFSVLINIGDRSDPQRPTWRAFRWAHLPWPAGCMFHAGPPPIPAFFEQFNTTDEFHLALGSDPDLPGAGSEFAGSATHHASGAMSTLDGDLNPFVIGLRGFWQPYSCSAAPVQTGGHLAPIGPVQCGTLPAPPQGDCRPADEKDCPPDVRQVAAQKYVGMIFGGSFDAGGLLPASVRRWIPLGVSGAVVAIGTTDLPGRQLTRFFAYAGAGISGGGSDLDRLAAAGAKEHDVGSPVQLESGAGGVGATVLGDSDFRKWTAAKLTMAGNSNRVELETGAGSFTFTGPHCNHDSGRNYYGVLRPVGPAVCEKLPDVSLPERECKDEEDCSEETRLAGHRHFNVKVGRLTSASLPPAARKRVAPYGCAVTAARLAIESEAADGGQIHRDFFLLARSATCGYTVAKGEVDLDLLLERQLATSDPDDIDALSDFIGGALLDDAGKLTIVAGTHLPLTLALPGHYDAACKGDRGTTGVVLPAGVVDCGPAPEPLHDTAAEPDHKAQCEDFKLANRAIVDREVRQLGAGSYDPLIGRLGTPPRLLVPPHIYADWLRTKPPGSVVNQAFFVGKAPAAAGAPAGSALPVVAFADVRILAINTDRTMNIQFLSAPCAFDAAGNVVALRPNGCGDDFAPAGSARRVGTIDFGDTVPSGPVTTAGDAAPVGAG